MKLLFTVLIFVYIYTVYMVIFANGSQVSPRENFHCNMWLFKVMKTPQNREIKPSPISPPSPKSRKYLYAKYIA